MAKEELIQEKSTWVNLCFHRDDDGLLALIMKTDALRLEHLKGKGPARPVPSEIETPLLSVCCYSGFFPVQFHFSFPGSVEVNCNLEKVHDVKIK